MTAPSQPDAPPVDKEEEKKAAPPPDPKAEAAELRCTICGLTACWTK